MSRRPYRVDPALLAFAREMRANPEKSELMVWYCLRDRRLNGYKFRKQFPIGPYIADFCCPALKLIVELDGESHDDRQAQDARRTEYLHQRGYMVVRYWNTDVQKNLEGVLLDILRECERLSAESPSPQPSPPSTGEREQELRPLPPLLPIKPIPTRRPFTNEWLNQAIDEDHRFRD